MFPQSSSGFTFFSNCALPFPIYSFLISSLAPQLLPISSLISPSSLFFTLSFLMSLFVSIINILLFPCTSAQSSSTPFLSSLTQLYPFFSTPFFSLVSSSSASTHFLSRLSPFPLSCLSSIVYILQSSLSSSNLHPLAA